MIKPYWNILTKRLQDSESIKTGLTIPYLFGAYQILGFKFETVRELLNFILDSSAKEYPVIEMCDVIKYDVLKLESKSEANKKRKKEFKEINKDTRNILFFSYNTNLGHNFNQVCANLWAKYQTPIEDKTFSWNDKSKMWEPFGPCDVEIIKEIK